MSDDPDFDTFWRSHELSVAVATAALSFLRDQTDYDGFRREVRCAYELHCIPDNIRPPRPSLRLVTGD
jgi:hypothetical protein